MRTFKIFVFIKVPGAPDNLISLDMKLKEKYGSKALIAGASEGIGAAYAEHLAAEGFSLVLIGRRNSPLQKLAKTLSDCYGVSVRCITCDLSEETATDQIISSLEPGEEPDILVYNAALSHIGSFTGHYAEKHCQACRVNMCTPLKLTHYYGAKMLKKNRGAIILMSSLAGLQGSAYLASYAAAKAFSRILAESLWYEWKNTGVDIIALCAGATSTPAYISSDPEKTGFFAPPVQEPGEVVTECFRKLGKRPSFISGRANRLASFFMQRMLSRKMAVKIMGNNIRKVYNL